MDYQRIAAYIEDMRQREPVRSQQELANEAGLSAGYISEIVNGKKKPSLEALEKIARVFRMGIGDFLAATGHTVYPELSWECDATVRVICRKGKLIILQEADLANS